MFLELLDKLLVVHTPDAPIMIHAPTHMYIFIRRDLLCCYMHVDVCMYVSVYPTTIDAQTQLTGGVKPDTFYNDDGSSCLLMASENGHTDIVFMLLDNDAKVHACIQRMHMYVVIHMPNVYTF